MKKVKHLSEETRNSLLKIATGKNFHGKKLDSKRLEVAEQAIAEVGLIGDIEARDLSDWLEKMKPAKIEKEKVKKEAVELVPTFGGSTQDRDALLPIMAEGTYIISSAQNNTLPHATLKNLEALAEKLSATLLLMPVKYTTTLEAMERKTPTYNKEVKPYLIEGDCWLGGRGMVRLAVSANILPTAKQPINTAEMLNNGESLTIVASPKRQIKTLTRVKEGGAHRWAYTTGSATLRHYTDTRAGAEGEQSHVFGAIVVCVENGIVRHQEIIADETGDFYLNKWRFSDGELLGEIQQVEGLVLGDLHCEKMCLNSWERAIAQVTYLKPKTVVCHDSLDFLSRNHHNRQSGKFLYQMGSRAVLDDLDETIAHINELAGLCERVFIVCSNHDLALDRWLDCPHYKADQDPINAKTYYFLKHAILESIDGGDYDIPMLEMAFRELADKLIDPIADNVVFGRLDQSFQICGFESGSHGHLGSGGARGSQKAFKKYAMKWISGHTHCPARDGDVITVGVTGSLEMGYNQGGSAWDRANAVIYPNGTSVLCPTYAIGEIQS